MSGEIDPHNLSDREILILLCERRESDRARADLMDERLKQHGQRLGTLEAWRTFLAGAWAVLSAIGWVMYGRH